MSNEYRYYHCKHDTLNYFKPMNNNIKPHIYTTVERTV